MFGLIRIGDRLRAAGSAEIARFDATPMPARVQAIIDKVLQTFPQFARCYSRGTAKVWAGLRPVSPSGVGYMGRTSIRNLFVNAGARSSGVDHVLRGRAARCRNRRRPQTRD